MNDSTEYITDSVSDYSIQSEDSDLEVGNSYNKAAPRRRSIALPLQYSSNSNNPSDSEMFTESQIH